MGPPEPSWWWWWCWCPAKPQLWLPTDGRGGWDGQHRQGLSVNRSWLFWGENAQHQPHLGLQSQPCQLTGPRSRDLGTCHGTTVPVSVTQELLFPLSRVVGSKVRSSGVSRTLDAWWVPRVRSAPSLPRMSPEMRSPNQRVQQRSLAPALRPRELISKPMQGQARALLSADADGTLCVSDDAGMEGYAYN